MDTEHWAARWREGRIGFHEGKANSFLAKHVGRLGQSRRVLVPLCGKAEDLAFLASQGHEVVGIEVVEDAVKAFFAEHELVPEVVKASDGVTAYSADRVTILAGDLFACTRAIVGKVDSLYDRAALVALNAETRKAYVKHLRALLQPNSTGLVVTFEYDQAKMEPPPFSVTEEEVRAHYAADSVELVDQGSADGPRFRAGGFEALEKCFALAIRKGED